jgi:4-hydroxyacetophenone monooxygenase
MSHSPRTADRAKRTELLLADDATIDDAVKYADPMALRGLLYQLTGDQELVAMEVASRSYGNTEMEVLGRESDVALVRSRAAAFLKAYRDGGAPEIPIGPRERLRTSVSLTTGLDIPESEVGLWIEQLALDPYARGLAWQEDPRPERLEEFRVAVIGAGMGGLNAAVLLKQAGIPYFVLEKNGDVGGTWYENRYPGARVDSASRTYTHVFGVDFIHPYSYCPQSVNLSYFEWIADRYGVRESITFHTEVRSVIWDDAEKVWEISADGPEGRKTWRASAVITAVGFLSRPNLPSIEGMDSFRGPAFHTARWPEGLDLGGKRVAVIGTGATGYQTIPEIAKLAGHVHVFQRTPGWCFDVPGYLAPLPAQVNWLDRCFPYFMNFARLRSTWTAAPQHVSKGLHVDPDFKDPHARSARNKLVREQRIAFIQRKLASRPELVEKMIPPYPPMGSRHILIDEHDNVYAALTRDNVTLVTEPIERITPDGIATRGGEQIPVDIIVYATGFRANDFLWPLEVRGRDGTRLEDLWAKDGPRAYLGTLLPGFPNFFMVYGPNTNNFGGLQIVDFEELVVRFALGCMGGLITRDKRTVEVTPDAYWRYNAELDRCESRMMYSDPRVNTYYRTRHGRSAANNPIDIRRIWAWTLDPSGGSRHPSDPCIRPYFGEDLVVE